MKTLTVHRTRLFEDELPLSNIDNASFEEDFKLDSSQPGGASHLHFYGKVSADLKQVLRLLHESERGASREMDSSFMQSLFAKVAQEIPTLVRRILEKHVRDQNKVAELLPDIDREIVARFRKVYESEQWIKTALQRIDEKVEEINQYETILATREIQLAEREALASELQLIYQQATPISVDRDKIELRQLISQLEVRVDRETAAKDRAKLEADYLRSKVEELQLKLRAVPGHQLPIDAQMEADALGLGAAYKGKPQNVVAGTGIQLDSPQLLDSPSSRSLQILRKSETTGPPAVGDYLKRLKQLTQSGLEQMGGALTEDLPKITSQAAALNDPTTQPEDPQASLGGLQPAEPQQQREAELPDSSESRQASA